MVAILRRPWPMLCMALLVLALPAGCSLVAPEQAPASRQERAARLAMEGKHAEAARSYAELGTASSPERDYYLLESAEQWLRAGNPAQAKQALAAVSAEARAKQPALRALVAAELALTENDGARAIRELDQIAVPTRPEEAQRYWWIRGNGAFLTGHPLEGVRAYVERERSLTDNESLRASREELYARIRSAAERGNSLKAPAQTDSIIAGWLELAPVALDLERNPMHAAAALSEWQKRFPLHPATDTVLGAAQARLAGATSYPDQIAVLLPLSGRAEPAGVAVRDGFIAAYLQQPAQSRPHLMIYDVAAQPAASAYAQAIAEGASFVVGPLTKEDVAAVVPLAGNARTPILALNFLSDSMSVSRNFYQFALLPEDEARIVARRVVADGKLAGVAILPDGEWGNRVGAAFADELSRLGGSLLDSQRYESSRADFADIILQVLQIHVVKGEPSTHRSDATFVFVAGTPGAARQILPQLKFHYAGDLPVYSTSDSFEPDPSANGDMDGLMFPDMPWMISNDPVTAQIRDSVRSAWPARTQRRDRLYAFGFDAYRLVPTLRSKSFGESAAVSGMTGKLWIDEKNRVRRGLDWAEIQNGVPAPL